MSAGLAKAAPGPQHAAGVNGSYLTPQASSGALAYQIEAAITSHLASKPDGKEYCPKLGIYLRGRNLIPTEGLKRFVMSRPEKFIFHDE